MGLLDVLLGGLATRLLADFDGDVLGLAVVEVADGGGACVLLLDFFPPCWEAAIATIMMMATTTAPMPISKPLRVF